MEADDLWMHEEMSGVAEEIESALPVVLKFTESDDDLEAVDDVFARIVSRLSPVETESMGNALRTIGRWAGDRSTLGQLATTVLPTAAMAAGTVYGGPVGAAVGRTVGERAAQAIAGKPGGPGTAAAASGGIAAAPSPAAGPKAATPPPPSAAPADRGDGSQAAAQLLYLVQNPSFLSSLVALALGSKGQNTVPVGAGDQQVPVGAFMTLANQLTGRAAEDADATAGDDESLSGAYLYDETGCLTCDPAVPAQRADALFRLLQREHEQMSALAESTETGEAEEESWAEAETWGDEESWDDDFESEWWPSAS